MRVLEQMREHNPLVHCMTNSVVTNFTANGLLAIGASPVMAYAQEEVADLAAVAGALLLNIGTLSAEQIESMIKAGKAANQAGVPVILDPVGAGATTFRTEMSLKILAEVKVDVLRGNGGEIASLIGVEAAVKGVDGAVGGDAADVARQAAKQFGCVAVVTGEVDFITDGTRMMKVANGHPWLTKVVGTGCLLGAVIGAFAALDRERFFELTTTAVAFYGIAAELAYRETAEKGIGSFQMSFLDQLSQLNDDKVCELRRVENGRNEGTGNE